MGMRQQAVEIIDVRRLLREVAHVASINRLPPRVLQAASSPGEALASSRSPSLAPVPRKRTCHAVLPCDGLVTPRSHDARPRQLRPRLRRRDRLAQGWTTRPRGRGGWWFRVYVAEHGRLVVGALLSAESWPARDGAPRRRPLHAAVEVVLGGVRLEASPARRGRDEIADRCEEHGPQGGVRRRVHRVPPVVTPMVAVATPATRGQSPSQIRDLGLVRWTPEASC